MAKNELITCLECYCECQICHVITPPPWFRCNNDHLYCRNCRYFRNQTECCVCKTGFKYGTRARVLENMAMLANLKTICSNKDCSFQGPFSDKTTQEHQETCYYRTFPCPLVSDCPWVGTGFEFMETATPHFVHHVSTFIPLHSIEFPIEMPYSSSFGYPTYGRDITTDDPPIYYGHFRTDHVRLLLLIKAEYNIYTKIYEWFAIALLFEIVEDHDHVQHLVPNKITNSYASPLCVTLEIRHRFIDLDVIMWNKDKLYMYPRSDMLSISPQDEDVTFLRGDIKGSIKVHVSLDDDTRKLKRRRSSKK